MVHKAIRWKSGRGVPNCSTLRPIARSILPLIWQFGLVDRPSTEWAVKRPENQREHRSSASIQSGSHPRACARNQETVKRPFSLFFLSRSVRPSAASAASASPAPSLSFLAIAGRVRASASVLRPIRRGRDCLNTLMMPHAARSSVLKKYGDSNGNRATRGRRRRYRVYYNYFFKCNKVSIQFHYRGRLYPAQNTTKHYPGRAGQNSLATAGTNFTKPGAQHKVDLCILRPRQYWSTLFVSHSDLA